MLSFAVSSCSSRSTESPAPKEGTHDVDVRSATIKGYRINVGDRATEVYDRIGTGSNAIVKNDQANPAELIMQHDYESGEKRYRFYFCKTADLQYHHLCRITNLKSSSNSIVPSVPGAASGGDGRGGQDKTAVGSGEKRSGTQLYTDEDLRKETLKKPIK